MCPPKFLRRRKEFIFIAIEQGDVPLHLPSKALVEQGGFRSFAVEYLEANLPTPGYEPEYGGVVLNGMGGEDGEFFQLWIGLYLIQNFNLDAIRDLLQIFIICYEYSTALIDSYC